MTIKSESVFYKEPYDIDAKILDLIRFKKHSIEIIIKHGGCFCDIVKIDKVEKTIQDLKLKKLNKK